MAYNVANLNTHGFKAHQLEFQDSPYIRSQIALISPDGQLQVSSDAWVGTGVTTAMRQLFIQGPIEDTGLATDFAIAGPGFFQVRLPDNTLAYTRSGGFSTDSQGRLVTANGYLLEPPVQLA